MLEIKNLCKTYKTKGGVVTKALDDVSLVFPEKGLVFLLGKSGSGKSTLLNMIGGLDRPDSGEIIVKGRSSKNFTQSDFDSYRNTYIGFIFQEYNVLNEFNIEQNISLALQLQGKKNDREAVNALLKEVNLEGFNKRKPNTLSGGQKQRIAIARALIKSPEIIMADEPTGALDSVTGRQVLETLKKLSQDKLVIIVSHDRDFAEEFGDRIIELKDGKILSDKTKALVPPQTMSENITLINGSLINIKNGAALTESDFRLIYDTIKKTNQGILISTGEENVAAAKKAQRISESGQGEVFVQTEGVQTKTYDPKKTNFIRSHLPFGRSFKMGASGLKTKPIRLIFTILLSVVSFTLFGVSTTLMFYNPSYSLAQAMAGSERKSEAIVKKYKYNYAYKTIDNRTGEVLSENISSYEATEMTMFGENELATLQSSRPNKFAGVFTLSQYMPTSSPCLPFDGIAVNDESRDFYYANGFFGLTDVSSSFLRSNGYSLIGEHPSDADSIAISNYHYDLIKKSGALGTIANESDLIGKKITISMPTSEKFAAPRELTITGIYDFGPVSSNFDSLKAEKDVSVSSMERQKLVEQYRDYFIGSFYSIGYVAPAFYDVYGFVPKSTNYYMPSASLKGISFYSIRDWAESDNVNYDRYTSVLLKEDVDALTDPEYYDTDFAPVDGIELNDNEVILPYGTAFSNYLEMKCVRPLELMVNHVGIYTEFLTEEERAFIEDYERRYDDDIENMQTAAGQALWQIMRSRYDESITAEIRNAAMTTVSNYAKGIVSKICELAYYRDFVETAQAVYRNNHDGQEIDEIEGVPQIIEEVYDIMNNVGDGYTQAMQEQLLNNANELLAKLSSEEQERVLVGSIARAFMRFVGSDYQGEINDATGVDPWQMTNDFVYSNTDLNEFKTFFESAYKVVYPYAEEIEYTLNPHFVKELKSPSYNGDWEVGHYYSKDASGAIKEYVVKGYVKMTYGDMPIMTRGTISGYFEYDQSGISTMVTKYVAPEDIKYSYLICPTDYSESDIAFLTANYDTYRYEMTNSIYSTAASMTNFVTTLNTVFLIIAGVTGALAALMLLNFISVSISSKNKDIGILRAVGARGSDVFKIFFSESALIAIICFVLAVVAAGVTCFYLNKMFIDSFLGISLLDFGFINVLLMLGIELVITLIATIIPVSIASRKPPVEAIRSL